VIFHQLDITKATSIMRFAKWARGEFPQGVEILVNNAGMAYKGDIFGADEAQVRNCF
jgi:carbonyl reductase 1